MMTEQKGGVSIGTVVAIVLAAAGLTVIALLLKPPPTTEAVEIMSSKQCLECHPGVAEEWAASHHGIAFKNPEVRRLSNDFLNEECLACHAPRPVLSFAAGERVLARTSERELGVDCLACHAIPGGGVATSNPTPSRNAPCRPQTVARMTDVTHCAACHNQHKTVDQWRASDPEIRGENCNGCHMPEVNRPGGRIGKDHSFKASHDLASLQSAVDFSGQWGDGDITVSLTNSGAAHNFPTDERSRAADIQVRFQNADGEFGPWEQIYRFRDPYRDEVELVNTQLPSGETWSRAIDTPNGMTAAEARIIYKTNPFMEDNDAKELYRVLLKP